jgi:hypothetical protein
VLRNVVAAAGVLPAMFLLICVKYCKMNLLI